MQEHTDQPADPAGEPHPEPQDTDPRGGIDDAVAALDELDRLPVAEHVERFDAVHTELTVALSSIDKV
ncbi:hypothetical protein BJF85_15210 [Saccharomonospora sp. CUA-673]|uniref:hypothetical protein n=1 Tax=Saccharomonospora sp. CUA-673 TaxID=1904969 RepID=UPI000959687D|nr:hypothetical protein [Saccharomonospora sp. CUA-673]OLT47540.1 hypothetical protein BJF85_15210 [Saccharomonospora sp. CUA-673]